MSDTARVALTFERLDQLSLKLLAGIEEGPSANLVATSLGPYFEWLWLRKAGHRLGRITIGPQLKSLQTQFAKGLRIWTDSPRTGCGFIRVQRDQADFDNSPWLLFCFGFERAAAAAGLSSQRAKQLTGALGELEDNIHEHSEAPHTGILAYCSEPGVFEFVVLDVGIGVLRSLQRCPDYAGVRDHGLALEIALADGNSRYGKESGHGYGFHDLHVGIVNSRAQLRFRSGDHLLELDGRPSGTPEALLSQKANGKGFLVAARCEVDPQPTPQ